ncbi:MAG: 50S ribosomal protein L2 [Patescibacteria group bacterium]
MAVKLYKPTTAGRRKSSVQDFSDITKTKPEKSLTVFLKTHAGRNNQGRITVRHKGAGVKKLYRLVDFRQNKYDLEAKVIAIEYDPNRSSRIALIEYVSNKEKSYVIAPDGLKVGDLVISSKNKIEPKTAYRMPLEYIPAGMFVYNVELEPGKGGQIARGAGIGAQLMVIEGKYAQLKMPSSEIRIVKKECLASIGQVSNSDWKLIRWGKAGRSRHRGIRPTVKGKNMNPVDHPHGGGEGHSPIGLKAPKTKWGKPALGVKTRKPRTSDKFILQRRKNKRK